MGLWGARGSAQRRWRAQRARGDGTGLCTCSGSSFETRPHNAVRAVRLRTSPASSVVSSRGARPGYERGSTHRGLGARDYSLNLIPGIVSLAWLALVVVSALEAALARSYALGPRMKQAYPHGTRRLVGAAGGVGDVPTCRGWG